MRSEDLGRAKWIRGLVIFPVQHCLLVKRGPSFKGIRRILSHEQVRIRKP